MKPRVTDEEFVDLHMHTVAHDGRWRPAELAEAASSLGLKVMAVTDHDTVKSVPEMVREGISRGIHVIPAVEVNVSWREDLYHLLLYNIDLGDRALRTMLDDLFARHIAKAKACLSSMERRGIVLPDLSRIQRGGDLLPVNLVNAVIKGGLAANFPDSLDLLGDDQILTSAVPIAQAVDVAHAQGALAVLAHPGRVDVPTPKVEPELLREMIGEVPLDGIEAQYSAYGPAETGIYTGFAAEHNLLVTCGSDSHGPRDRRKLIAWPANLCREFLTRCGIDK